MSEAELELKKSKTIEDFGDQWTRFQKNEGYYGSQEMMRDIQYGE